MPDVILSALWRASWQAGVVCLLVLALRWTLRDRLPPVWRCRLWGLVFLRLLLPAVPASPLSLFNVVPPDPVPADIWPTLTVVVHQTVDMPPPGGPGPAMPVEVPRRPFPWSTVLLAAWLGGAAALAAATAVSHARFARRVRRSSHPAAADVLARWHALGGRRPVVVTDAVTSPALFGLARGRLLLPPDLTARLGPAEVDLVFRHELAHVRRWDLAVGWAAVMIRCAYWVQPLVWLAVTARRADAESACDDAVVVATGDRPAYGRVVLAVAGSRSVPAVGMADARTDLRRRLARLAAGRRVGWRSTVAAAVLTVAVGCAALTRSDRPANVTRTYSIFWPADYNSDPLTGGLGSTTTVNRGVQERGLVDVIRRNVTPDAWGHHGIDVHTDGRLAVVTAPPETQAAIERMIAEKSVQVSIAIRVLTLRPSQVRATGLAVPDVGVVGPIPEDGVTALIRAHEADPTTTLLSAPRLTLFNGQKTLLWVETQQAYVSSLTPVVAPGAALFDPVVSTVPAVGLRLSVHVTVSPDHRSGDMAAHVELKRLLSLDPAVMTCTVGKTTIQGTMQLPRQWKMVVDADVTIPSGGSVWVRGQPTETYGSSTRPIASTQPAEADAAETFVTWHVVVLPPRPMTTPATRVAAGRRPAWKSDDVTRSSMPDLHAGDARPGAAVGPKTPASVTPTAKATVVADPSAGLDPEVQALLRRDPGWVVTRQVFVGADGQFKQWIGRPMIHRNLSAPLVPGLNAPLPQSADGTMPGVATPDGRGTAGPVPTAIAPDATRLVARPSAASHPTPVR